MDVSSLNLQSESFKCECGKDLIMTKLGDVYELNACPCGRKGWMFPTGGWRGTWDGPMYFYPEKSN